MNTTKTNKMKSRAVSAAMAVVLGAGATALLLPSIANAVAQHRTDDTLARIRQSRTHDAVSTVSTVRQARQGADDMVGHLRHSATDDTVGHAKHGGVEHT